MAKFDQLVLNISANDAKNSTFERIFLTANKLSAIDREIDQYKGNSQTSTSKTQKGTNKATENKLTADK